MAEGAEEIQRVGAPDQDLSHTKPIRPPKPLNMDSTVQENWKLFKQKWQNYAILTKLQEKPREYQTALFLHTLGREALKVYNGFKFETAETNRTVDEIIKKFDAFFCW